LIFLKTNCNKKSKAFKNPGNLLLYYGSLRVVFLRENTINLKHHSHLYFLSGVLFDFLQPEYSLPTIAGAPTIAGCLPDSFKNRDKKSFGNSSFAFDVMFRIVSKILFIFYLSSLFSFNLY